MDGELSFRLRAFCRAEAMVMVARASGTTRRFDDCVIDAMEAMAAEDRASLESDLARMRAIEEAARGFAESVEAAERNAVWKDGGSKGMGVPFHDDFAGMERMPSIRSRLNWWAREIRAALATTTTTEGE